MKTQKKIIGSNYPGSNILLSHGLCYPAAAPVHGQLPVEPSSPHAKEQPLEGGSSSDLLSPHAQVLQELRIPLQTQPHWVRKTRSLPPSCLQLSFEHHSSYELGMP